MLWWFASPFLAVGLLWLFVPTLGPAYEARLGGGIVGSFTATDESCGRYGCSFTGDFTSTNGGTVIRDVSIGSGSGLHEVGQVVPAVDTGGSGPVYPRDGGWDWFFHSGMTVFAAGLGAAWLHAVIRRLRRTS